MANRPWMPLYIADYLADTSHLGALQSGAYLHLIMHYWQHGGLPPDDTGRARVARLSPVEWKRERDTLAAFFQDGWEHKRIDAELAEAAAIQAAKSQAGKRGAEKRWRENNSDDGKPIADASSSHRQTDAQSPSQPQKEEISPPSEARPPADDGDVNLAVEIYHTVAERENTGWPIVRRVTAQRRSAVLARLRDCGGIEGWHDAMERAGSSSFLRGANEKGWRADFDFFCQSKSFTKLMEGSYDDHKPTGTAAGNGKQSPHTAFLGALAREAEKRSGGGERETGSDDGGGDFAGLPPPTPGIADDLEIPTFLRRQ